MTDSWTARDRVSFLFTKLHKLPFSTLSFNVAREICSYLEILALYPCFSNSSLTVHTLSLGTSHTHSVKGNFNWQVAMCFIDWRTLICIATARRPCTIDLLTATITFLEDMPSSRDNSGLIRAGSFVYAFGGSVNGKVERLADKYALKDGHWQQIASLPTPKFAFTPCKWKQQLYLAEIDAENSSLDAFCTLSETYTSYPWKLPSSMNGCIGFISSGQLVLLSIGRQRVRWDLEDLERKPQVETLALANDNDAYSNCQPIIFGGNVFWVNYLNGKLVKYNLASEQLTSTA